MPVNTMPIPCLMPQPILSFYNLSQSVTAFSTTRHGGFSQGAYGEFNINRYCGDDEECINRNREALGLTLGISPNAIIMPHQTHGNEVRQIAKDFLALPETVKSMVLEGVDALITDVGNICIGVSTADCIPIIIYDPEHNASAAVHAGWRSTVQLIAQKAVTAMHMAYGSRPDKLMSAIGPGISLDAFEVGDEVYDEFSAAGFDMGAISLRKEKWHIDLKECNRRQLVAFGLQPENIAVSPICTFSSSSDYFSARRLGTASGRIYTGIMLK